MVRVEGVCIDSGKVRGCVIVVRLEGLCLDLELGGDGGAPVDVHPAHHPHVPQIHLGSGVGV